jgi:hypothetical protein
VQQVDACHGLVGSMEPSQVLRLFVSLYFSIRMALRLLATFLCICVLASLTFQASANCNGSQSRTFCVDCCPRVLHGADARFLQARARTTPTTVRMVSKSVQCDALLRKTSSCAWTFWPQHGGATALRAPVCFAQLTSKVCVRDPSTLNAALSPRRTATASARCRCFPAPQPCATRLPACRTLRCRAPAFTQAATAPDRPTCSAAYVRWFVRPIASHRLRWRSLQTSSGPSPRGCSSFGDSQVPPHPRVMVEEY